MRRTDEAFKAEVFSRSKKYIKKQRTKRRIAASCCVPLVLCAVIAVPLLASQKNADDGCMRPTAMNNSYSVEDEALADETFFTSENQEKSEAAVSSSTSAKAYAVAMEISVYPDSDRGITSSDPETVSRVEACINETWENGTKLYGDEPLNPCGDGWTVTLKMSDETSLTYIIAGRYIYLDGYSREINDEYASAISELCREALSF